MRVTLRKIAGLDLALDWMRFSFGTKSEGFPHTVLDNGEVAHLDDVTLGQNLVKKGDSHAKFTRFIFVWLEVEAPRYFWQEFDQYKFTVQAIPPDTLSESTVHTVTRRPLVAEDFEGGFPDKEYLDRLNEIIEKKNMRLLKKMLPESFLQTRGIILNYQTIRKIWVDRHEHKLQEWHTLLDVIEDQLPLFKEFVLAGG